MPVWTIRCKALSSLRSSRGRGLDRRISLRCLAMCWRRRGQVWRNENEWLHALLNEETQCNLKMQFRALRKQAMPSRQEVLDPKILRSLATSRPKCRVRGTQRDASHRRRSQQCFRVLPPTLRRWLPRRQRSIPREGTTGALELQRRGRRAGRQHSTTTLGECSNRRRSTSSLRTWSMILRLWHGSNEDGRRHSPCSRSPVEAFLQNNV